LAAHLNTLLEGMVAEPEQPFADLPLLTRPERQQVVVEWNATESLYPRDQGLAALFEEQVQRTPHAVALSYESEQLTYEELNARANQLAHYLRLHGVGLETLVGVHLERSPDMVIGLLAILKAGGVYVPLDLSYPQERIAFMLADAQISVLLTQER